MKNLKSNVRGLLAIALVAVIGFAMITCGGDDEEENPDGTNPGGGGALTSVQGADVYYFEGGSKAAGVNGKVYTQVWGGEYDEYREGYPVDKQFEVGRITNGKLSFTLPNISAADANKGSTVADEFGGYGYDVIINTVTAVPSDAKMLQATVDDVISFYVILDGSGDEAGLMYGNGTETGDDDNGTSTYNFMIYVYLNKPATVTGEHRIIDEYYSNNSTYNCTFTAGWNSLYISGTSTHSTTGNTKTHSYNDTYSTSKPAGAGDMRWYIFSEW